MALFRSIRVYFIGLLVCALYISIYSSSNAYYGIKRGENVYTWKSGYPQGCTCAQSDSTKKTCVLFKCECLCDLSADICDYNCCCDPDCSTEQIARFKSLEGGCAYDGSESYRLERCYSSVELYGINPRGPIGGKSTSEAAVGQALCVEKYNTAIREEFYTDASIVSSVVFDTTVGTKPFSYMESLTSSSLLSDTSYDRNDSIAAYLRTDSGSLISNGPGYFQLPRADETGYCNDHNYVTFENDVVDKGSCARELSSESQLFVSQCEHQFSVARYITALRISKTSNVSVTDDSVTSSELVAVRLNKVLFVDYWPNGHRGTAKDITAQWTAHSCYTRGYAGNAQLNSNCIFSSSYGSNDSELAVGRTFCQGFVKAVTYNVIHDSSTKAAILSVSADVIISDVPMRIAHSTSSVTVSQSFSVRFKSVGSNTVTSSTNGNQVQRMRSGNPGYVLGLPVLYGFYNTSLGVINELVDGFSVPSSFAPYDASSPDVFGRAICPQSSSSGGQVSVRFGYDLLSGCTVELTRDELLDMCCAGSGSCSGVSGSSYSSPYSDSSGMPYFLDFKTGYVGNYGNADPLDQGQWTKASYQASADNRRWDDRLSTCRKMFTALEVQFLVAWSGSRTNPQNKIVSSLVKLTTSDWVMKIPAGDSLSKQAFSLSVVVSFVFQQESKLQGYVAPPPPVLFQIPYDAFYPFIGDASNAGMHSASINAVLYLLVVMVTTWCLL